MHNTRHVSSDSEFRLVQGFCAMEKQVSSSPAGTALRKYVADEMTRLGGLLAEYDAAEEALAQRAEERQRQHQWVPLVAKGSLKLDVGGEIFFTTLSSLRSKPGLLRAVCDGVGSVSLDRENCLFIDRSPLAFRYVLNHLGDEPLSAAMTAREKETLLLDAEFYELSELSKQLGGKGQALDIVSRAPFAQESDLVPVVAAAWKDLRQREEEAEQEVAGEKRLREKIAATVGGEKVKLQLRQERCRFSTRVTTLTSGGGKLQAKFAREWQADVEENGAVFLNANGTTFELVLNMLRGYPFSANLTAAERESFAHDLEHFALETPKEMPKEMPQAPVAKDGWELTSTPNAVLSQDNLFFRKSSPNKWDCATIGSVGWTAGVHEWTVTIVSVSSVVMIGVASSNIDRIGTNQATCGFYLYVSGALYAQDGTKGKAFCATFNHQPNATVVVRLDCDNHTLSFGVNGQPSQVAFSNLPAVELFPALECYTSGAVVRVKP
jgi:hypothetical protein